VFPGIPRPATAWELRLETMTMMDSRPPGHWLRGNVNHNNGNGTFTDVTAKAGVRSSGWTISAGFFDYNNDGRLDIFVTRYLDWTFDNNPYCGDRVPGYRAYCHPNNFLALPSILYRNNGDGTFTDVSKESGIADQKGKSLGVAFVDYDKDGWMDIFVANDSVQCFLFHNKGDGTFTERGLVSGAGLNQDGRTFAGMGADFADYDNDRWPDIIVTICPTKATYCSTTMATERSPTSLRLPA
jgi:enediyne biosynthesis protein E4